MKAFPFLASLAMTIAVQADGAAPITLEIGGRPIVVPLPSEDFVRIDGIEDSFDSIIEATIPASNRLLANFGTQEDLDTIHGDGDGNFTRTFNIQTLRAYESEEIGLRTFDGIRGGIRKELETLKSSINAELAKNIDAGNRKTEDEYGVDVGLSISNTTMLGVFEDNKQTLGFTMAMNLGIDTPEEKSESHSVVAVILAPINGRLLMLYSTAPYQSQADQKTAELSVSQWRDAIVASNPTVEGPPAKSSGHSIGRSALIGAAIGGVLGLIGFLNKRRNG